MVWLFCHRRIPPLRLYPSSSGKAFLVQEQTIRTAVECSGVGLHSGAPVTLRILPAPANTGIIFRRTDLDGFEVEATGRNVARVSYATSLMKKGVLISTTEHLLSAFVGMGIDNAYVELDNLELPILDGSARPFVDLIRRAGIRKQRAPANLCPNSSCPGTSRRQQVYRCLPGGRLFGFLRHQFCASADWARDLQPDSDQRELRFEHCSGAHFRISA